MSRPSANWRHAVGRYVCPGGKHVGHAQLQFERLQMPEPCQGGQEPRQRGAQPPRIETVLVGPEEYPVPHRLRPAGLALSPSTTSNEKSPPRGARLWTSTSNVGQNTTSLVDVHK